MSTAVLFLIAMPCKQLMCPSMDERTEKSLSIPIMEYLLLMTIRICFPV